MEGYDEPIKEKRVFPVYKRNHPRSIVARQHIKADHNLFRRACFWLLPWERRDYPGIGRGLEELMRGHYTKRTIFAFRYGHRRMTAKAAKVIGDIIESRLHQGALLLAEVRKAENDYVSHLDRPSGFIVVRDRGDGIVRDARGRGARKL